MVYLVTKRGIFRLVCSFRLTAPCILLRVRKCRPSDFRRRGGILVAVRPFDLNLDPWQTKMRKVTYTLILVLYLLALSADPASGQASIPYRPLRLPGGKHFPASQATLLGMRDRADLSAKRKMRAHAWDLFEGLTKGRPVWET